MKVATSEACAVFEVLHMVLQAVDFKPKKLLPWPLDRVP